MRLKKHVIWRFFVHYPGQPLRIPQYLLNAGLPLYDTEYGKSPSYDDPLLLDAFRQFIAALGDRYDGAKGLGFIQMGLLGFWGEWHTYPATGLLSETTQNQVVRWFADAFSITLLQTRYPLASAYAARMGYHDDSFAYNTLDGAANAGKTESWFFWPSVIRTGQTDFWKYAPMGGETRPEIQGEVFEESYPAGTVENKQDFMLCVETTHATYIIHVDAFKSSSPYTGKELENARRAHASMGYNFRITRVAVASGSAAGTATVDVTVQQVGVAPFYYPLSLVLQCQGAEKVLNGVESLVSRGDSKVFSFTGIPADSSCFESVSFRLQSEYVHKERPVLFAQGSGNVSLRLPLPPPPSTTIAPAGPGSPTNPAPALPTVRPLPSTDVNSPSDNSLPKVDESSVEENCFSSNNMVDVLGKGIVSLDRLEIGDYVRSRDDHFSRVYSFSHIDRRKAANFLQIYLSGLPSPLEISPKHMVFVKDKAVRAESVNVGDWMGNYEVQMIKSIKLRGVYAPVTESGEILVNGILASCYVSILDNAPFLDQHRIAHAFLALQRSICRWNFDFCVNESYTDEGYSFWIMPAVHFAAIYNNSISIFRAAVSFTSLPFAILSLGQISALAKVVLVIWLLVIQFCIRKAHKSTHII
jgi:hypothetical protein